MKDRVPLPGRLRQGVLASIAALVVVVALAAPAAAAPSYGSGGSGTNAAPSSVQVGTGSTSLGEVLTGPDGRTLYTLSSDPSNGSVCTGQCLTAWPPLLVAAGGSVSGPSGMTFGTFVRTDTGETQVAESGHALYYFQNDTAPGQTNGEGIAALGGVWHAAKASASSSSGSTTSGSTSSSSSSSGSSASSSVPPTTTSGATTGASGGLVPLGLVAIALLAFGATLFATRRRQAERID